MKIAYTTTFDATDVHNWSGTPFHMAKALTEANFDLNYIGKLKRHLPPFFKAKQFLKAKFANQRESPRFNIHVAKAYSRQVEQQLTKLNVDAIVSPLINPIAYLETDKPIILWTDAVYAALVGFYPPFSYHSSNTIAQGNAITQACLSRCAKLIFSSDWAAQSAIQLYGVDPAKVHVIPFGANIGHWPTENEIGTIIKNRSTKTIHLLFMAKSWERKGGDKVLAIAKALHEQGHRVQLNILGFYPPDLNPIPSYVNCLGFISKNTAGGKEKIHQLLAHSHFLIVPSIAEAYGIVFCEANAFGIPCLTSHVGGIATIVKDNVNGKKYALDAPVARYCEDILAYFSDYQRYIDLAHSAYQEFTSRLNWQVAARNAKNIITQVA